MRRHDFITDVSGRMEKMGSKDAALAFSNSIEAAVFAPGKVKLAVHRQLKRQGVPTKRRGAMVLTAGLYLLFESYLNQANHIIIDDELPGWGDEIKQRLLNLIRLQCPQFNKLKLDIRRIGENTRADKLAWLVRTKEESAKKLTAEDFTKVLQKMY